MSSRWYGSLPLVTAAILWPALIAAVALAWPGPGTAVPYEAGPGIGPATSVLPATDQSGSTVVFTPGNGELSARIFWEIPTAGRIHLTIELDAGQPEDPAAAVAPDSGSPATQE